MDAHGAGHCFHHEALLYAGDEQFLAGTLPYLREAIAAGEPVLVAILPRRIEILTDALGEDAGSVQFADMRELGRNPARIIPAWGQFLKDNVPEGAPARGIGEPIWRGRGEAELTECQRHEELLNVAFDDGAPWHLLCPHDVDALEDH